jgi:hypothetical protein
MLSFQVQLLGVTTIHMLLAVISLLWTLRHTLQNLMLVFMLLSYSICPVNARPWSTRGIAVKFVVRVKHWVSHKLSPPIPAYMSTSEPNWIICRGWVGVGGAVNSQPNIIQLLDGLECDMDFWRTRKSYIGLWIFDRVRQKSILDDWTIH